MVDPMIVVQPRLQMTTATAAKIAQGLAYQVGGVVREVGTGRLVELLNDAPDLDEVAEQVAQQVKKMRLPRLDSSRFELPKLGTVTATKAGGAILVLGLALGGAIWVAGRRKGDESVVPAEVVKADLVDATVEDPECLVNFRASLNAYVESGAGGALTPQIIGNLVTDLDAVEAYSEEGNVVVFTLDELMPFFELVTSHTPVLAKAYGAVHEEEDDASGDVVVSLRRHLEAQRAILSQSA
ncbi:hypothetical protein [Terrabacter carboxydivorans]|uniref:DUF4129 domain-containing protein n=1 Tax=Terrabacter carboxydivorans TaxID=619730 RepID=A0ABP5ZWA1_9MICO